jgi:hypothetical protein
MARAIESWSICKDRYRIHSIKPVGRHPAQIIEIENVDTGARFHGSGRQLARIAFSLQRSSIRTELQTPNNRDE